MDFGKLLNRAWTIVWEHKFLILLGILVALGSSGGSSVSSGSQSFRSSESEWQMPHEWRGGPFPPAEGIGLPALPIFLTVVLVGIALIIAVAVWVVSTLARGALIAGVSQIDAGHNSSFGEAFSAALHKGWTLLGIGIFPAIPALFLLLTSLGAAGIYLGASQTFSAMGQVGPRNVWWILGALICIALPLMLILNLLSTFANRACMLEDSGVFAAYRWGFSVLLDNFGAALVLFLIQIGIGLVLGLLLLLPALCCLLWPLLLIVQGGIAAYFSTVWTLAWRRWVEATPVAEEVGAAEYTEN